MSKSNKLEFSWKYKDYRLLACQSQKTQSDHTVNDTIAFVKIHDYEDGRRCVFALAQWVRNSKGYYLYLINRKALEQIAEEDIVPIWNALKEAQCVLDEWFEFSVQNARMNNTKESVVQ